METYLIVNADEFGLTEGVNEAIIDCHRNGILTSTTIMTNAWAFEDAVSQARESRGLGVGIHVNFTFGRPEAGNHKVSSLVDGDGLFLPRPLLLKRWLGGNLRPGDVETEMRAQIQKALDAGINPTHLDSHQNSMMIPCVFKVFLKVATEMKLPIRLPYEPPNFDGFSSVLQGYPTWRHAKKRVTAALCSGYRRSLCRTGVRTVDRIYSLASCFMPPDFSVAERYDVLITSIGPGVSELFAHPGRADVRLEDFLGGSISRARQREEEHAALTRDRLKEAVRSCGIRLINYKGLA